MPIRFKMSRSKRVTWREYGSEEPALHSAYNAVCAKYGPGPFQILGMEQVPTASRQDVGHDQWLLIDVGEDQPTRFSGAFFKYA